MIINIRGTSGSGKTTIVKQAMELFPRKDGVMINGRRNPIGYWLGSEDITDVRQLAVPGHYETACGGCDTLSGYDQIFRYVREGGKTARHLIFEGLLVSEEHKRTLQLHHDFPSQLLVIQLTTSEAECIASVEARRQARGNDKPLNPANTVNRIRTVERVCQHLKEQGVAVEQHDRNSAWNRVKEIING